MKIQSYQLSSFEEKEIPKDGIHRVTVPEGSNFLKTKVLHDGVYVWYAIPELEVQNTVTENFVIMRPGMSIPDNADFIDIVDTIIEMPPGEGETLPRQGILVLPIYKLKD